MGYGNYQKSGSKYVSYGRKPRSMKKRKYTSKKYSKYSIRNRLIPKPKQTIERKASIIQVPSLTNFSYDVPIIYLANGLAQGTNTYERVGNKVNMKGFYIRGQIVPPTGINCAYTIRLILDKQPNMVIMPLDGAVGTGRYLNAALTLAYPWEHTDPNGRDRYVTLWEHSGCVNQSTTTLRDGQWFQKFVPLNFTTQYCTSSVLISGIQTNALWIVFYSDRASVSTPPQVQFSYKYTYTDA